MPSARRHKLQIPLPKPRNPLVAAAAQRKAGKHQKSPSAQRQADRAALRKLLRDAA